jgi:corrinoid protein of di/trimethylamine methyltransferase
MSVEKYLESLKQSIIQGNAQDSVKLTIAALTQGLDPIAILNDGIMLGANIVGKKFEAGEFFLPELMLTGRAIKAAMSELEVPLKASYIKNPELKPATGTVVIATIQTDIHDIGKNMVASMLSAAGFKVHDLGVDVPVKTIIARAKEVKADIIACSALLTTSMPVMRDLLNLLVATDEREHFKVIVGGASVTPQFSNDIGSDGTADNAIHAVQLAQRLIREQYLGNGVV